MFILLRHSKNSLHLHMFCKNLRLPFCTEDSLWGDLQKNNRLQRKAAYKETSVYTAQCYSNNPYPSQNHCRAIMSFLRLLRYEKYSCIAHCNCKLLRNQAISSRTEAENVTFLQTWKPVSANNLLVQRCDSVFESDSDSIFESDRSILQILQNRVK